MIAAMDKELLRTKDIEVYCGISRTTLWRKIKDGAFPEGSKIGGLLFWRKSAVDEWITQNTENNKPQ